MLVDARGMPAPKAPTSTPAAPARALTAPPAYTDVSSSGRDYGGRTADAYKATPAYHQAIVSVFRAQPPAQKAAVLKGVLRLPASAPERQAVLGEWGQMDRFAKMPVAEHLARLGVRSLPGYGNEPIGSKPGGPAIDLGSVAGGALSALRLPGSGGIGDYRSFGGAVSPQGILSGAQKADQALVKGLKAARDAWQIAPPGPGNVSTMGVAGPKFSGALAGDIANLAGAPLTTLALTAKDIPHPHSLLNDFISWPKQMIEHPGQAAEQHPGLFLATLFGGLAGASRAAAAPVRAFAPADSALGRVVSTDRPSVYLTGRLTHERPDYSKSPWVKYTYQKPHETAHYKEITLPDGKMLHPKSDWLYKRQVNSAVGSLLGMRERFRNVGQEEAKAAHLKEFAYGGKNPLNLAKRGVNAAKKTFAIAPERASVPGGEVASLIADRTVRGPETYAADLTKYRDLIARNRPNLVQDVQDGVPNAKEALAVHDANVRLLNHEINAKRTPQQLERVFKAVESDREAYLPLEMARQARGDYGTDMTTEGLFRRSLQHYAQTHMGGRIHPELGLVRGLENSPEPFPTSAILEHMRGPEGTGGRMPTYTSDFVHPDLRENPNSEHYVPGERLPRPRTASNTGYVYTHGLQNLSHTALLERRLYAQNVVDAHGTRGLLAHSIGMKLPGERFATSYKEAKKLTPRGYVPFNLAEPFHPQSALEKSLEAEHVDPLPLEEEAQRKALDISRHLAEAPGPGRWGMADKQAVKAVTEATKNISPDIVSRSFRSLNNQFRTVVLSTSAKHVPGVMFENLIRDVAHGVGVRSWVTGHLALQSAKRQLSPDEYRQLRTHLAGGQVAGMTDAMKTYRVSDHWAGTSAYPFLKAMEGAAKYQGPRHLRAVWRAWSTFAIKGTKKLLEEQHQIAGLGKGLMRQHGYAEALKTDGFTGMFQRALTLHGRMLDDAVKGLVDPVKARQMRALINQMYGKWTDLSPGGQRALMFSPFGLWWVNSARFLLRAPVDMPVKTGMLASLTAAKENERKALHMNFLSPGALAGYKMGGIPAGDKEIAMNYYSPFGMVNDPFNTATSLIEPWLMNFAQAAAGRNWLWDPLSSPNNPKGRSKASGNQIVQAIIDGAFASFVPTYTMLKGIASGGVPRYDVADKGWFPNPFNPPTKEPGKGIVAGIEKTLRPWRQYSTSPGGSAGKWSFGGSASSPSGGSGGWNFGGGSSSSAGSSNGWNFGQ